MRRGEKGQFKESDAVAHSLSQDVRRKAQTVVNPGLAMRINGMVIIAWLN